MIAVITNQNLKGIEAFALGSAAGKMNQLMNSCKVLKNLCDSEAPIIAFCTPEYLFGSPEYGRYKATIGQFDALKNKANEMNLVILDEALKIFDRLPSYRPAFDGIKS